MRWLVNLGLFVVVCLLALTLEYFGYQVSETVVQSTKQANRIMTNIKIQGVAPREDLNYTLETSRLIQNPDDGVGRIDQPFVAHFNHDGYFRTAQSDSGIYYEDAKFVVMEGNVRVSVVNGIDLIPVISSTHKMRFNLSQPDEMPLPDLQ